MSTTLQSSFLIDLSVHPSLAFWELKTDDRALQSLISTFISALLVAWVESIVPVTSQASRRNPLPVMELGQTLPGRIRRSVFFVISLWSNTVCWAKIPETEQHANNSALSMAFNVVHSAQSAQKFVYYARSARKPNVGLSQRTILSAESRRSSKRHSYFY